MKSLKVSEDVWCAAKIQATQEKITLTEFVEKALWYQVGRSKIELASSRPKGET